jgi:crossover junction endodeoxyribonuclease RusA
MSVRITLPWPPQATSANGSQGKFRAKATAAKGYKSTCAWIIRAAHIKPVQLDAPLIRVTFCAPARTSRYDLDNMLGRCKQGLDAVAEAIGIDDSQWQGMDLRRGPKGGVGSVIVEVMEGTQDAVLVPIVGQIS